MARAFKNLRFVFYDRNAISFYYCLFACFLNSY